MVSIVDLGMVHDVARRRRDRRIAVELLPTFVGCPALEVIRGAVAERLAAFGRPVDVATTFRVPWTTDRISAGRAAARSRAPASPTPAAPDDVRCPYCASARVVMDSTLRADAVPLAVLLPRLPPAVRGDEARLATDDRRRWRSWPSGQSASSGPGRWVRASPRSPSRPATRSLLHDVDDAAIERGRAADPSGLERRAAPARPRRRLRRRLGRRPARGPSRRADALPTWSRPSRTSSSRPRSRTSRRSGRSSRRSTRRRRRTTILATNTSALSVDGDRGGDGAPGSRPRASTSSTRRRSCRSSRSSSRRATDPAVADAGRRRSSTAGARPPVRCADTPGLHRQPGQPAVHARGAARSSPRRGATDRGDRRGDPRSRLPDGSVRADGPRRHRRQPRRGRRHLRALSGGGDPSPSASGRRRSRSDSSRRAGSVARPARGSTGYGPDGRRDGPARRRSRAEPPRSTRRRRRDRARIVDAIVDEAERALGEGVATREAIDLALRLGAGHPIGPFERAAQLERIRDAADSAALTTGSTPDGHASTATRASAD